MVSKDVSILLIVSKVRDNLVVSKDVSILLIVSKDLGITLWLVKM